MSPSHDPLNSCNGRQAHSDVYDLICVGFGPASLAIAVAIRDLNINAKVLFLERQPYFAWHAGMLIPNAKMQISFLKDLATFRDPRSHFTFLNYLKQKGRLEAFANLGTFLPLREEFNDYLNWAADHFQDIVEYGIEVKDVHAAFRDGGTIVDHWNVKCQSLSAKRLVSFQSKNIVIAVGGSPKLPRGVHSFGPKVIHSSQYLKAIQENSHIQKKSAKLAVIGGGQSAAEIFDDLISRFSRARIEMFITTSALKPSDDSPFVNEIFNPDQVDGIYSLRETERCNMIAENRPTNYSVVRPELLDRLYEKLYHQRLQTSNPSQWRFQIQASRELSAITEMEDGKMTLGLVTTNGRDRREIVESNFDLVFVATGYTRTSHEAILQPIQHLLQDSFSSVERDYKLILKEGALDSNCGIWLQGCCEASHGLSDSLLSILAVRGGEIVRSIFGQAYSTPSLNNANGS